MHPLLAAGLANSLSHDRVFAARTRRAAKAATTPGADDPAPGDVVIRRADATDAAALVRLGALDSDRRAGALLGSLAGDHRVLVAEVDGKLEAAQALDGDIAVADPFRPSAVNAELLALRARQLAGVAPRRSRARLHVLSPRTS
jgi:hypothetical protein